jgi:hypothetical protein
MPISGKVLLKGRKVGCPYRTYGYFPLTRSAYFLVLKNMRAVGLRQEDGKLFENGAETLNSINQG